VVHRSLETLTNQSDFSVRSDVTSHWHQNEKLQFIDINLDQNKTLVSMYVTSNIENSVVLAVDK
jgi:hypothetical protein